jgi:hypothetical protein
VRHVFMTRVAYIVTTVLVLATLAFAIAQNA